MLAHGSPFQSSLMGIKPGAYPWVEHLKCIVKLNNQKINELTKDNRGGNYKTSYNNLPIIFKTGGTLTKQGQLIKTSSLYQ